MSLGSTLATATKKASRTTEARRDWLFQSVARNRGRRVLTPRLAELWDLLARGKSNKECARAMGLAGIQSLKVYINNLYSRLGVSSRSQAVSLWWAVRLEKWIAKYGSELNYTALQELCSIHLQSEAQPETGERWLT